MKGKTTATKPCIPQIPIRVHQTAKVLLSADIHPSLDQSTRTRTPVPSVHKADSESESEHDESADMLVLAKQVKRQPTIAQPELLPRRDIHLQ